MNDPPLLPQALRLLRREMRGGLRGFGVFLTCLFLGVFSISAIGSFTESAKGGLLADASALLGGDFEIRQAHRGLPEDILAYLGKRGELSHVVTMRTMVADQNGTRRTLAELKAVDAAYPLYGQLISDPQQAIDQALAGGQEYGALVDQGLKPAMLSKLKKTFLHPHIICPV